VKTENQPRRNWTVLLRRQLVRLVGDRVEGGWTNEFEIVCCGCGDNPDLDYREISPKLQRIRGPYQMEAGVAALERHARQHPTP
jgi:hypothetical protein